MYSFFLCSDTKLLMARPVSPDDFPEHVSLQHGAGYYLLNITFVGSLR